MKARIRKTGEIINLADYAVITLDSHDSYGNPIEMKPEEVELIQEPNEDAHWLDVRERAAIAAMQVFLANPNRQYQSSEALAFADALVEQLKRK